MRRRLALLCGCLIVAWPLPARAGEGSPTAPSKRPRDRTSDALMATGGTVLCIGVVAQIVGFATWYRNAMAYRGDVIRIEPDLVPGVEIGIGLGFSIIGGAFLGVGIQHQKRFEASLAGGTVRLEFRPIGLAGRF